MSDRKSEINAIAKTLHAIVKRKTIYNETNIHYEYFKVTGETIPFKDFGYNSLRQMLERNARKLFYFEDIGDDLACIGPKDLANTSTVGDTSVGNPITNCGNVTKRVCVLNEMKLEPYYSILRRENGQSTQIRNNLRVSFDINIMPETKKNFITEQKCGNWIEMPNENEKSLVDGDNTASTDGFRSTTDSMQAIDTLPWHQKYWQMEVTKAVSTDEVWARLIDYTIQSKTKFDLMSSELAELMHIESSHPKQLSSEKIYLVKINTDFYRVQVIKIESETKKCKCILIDDGTSAWYKQTKLYRCPKRYQSVPPLAIRFALYGLSEFNESKKAAEILSNELTGKYVWAKIKTTQDEYYEENDNISVVFYDSPKSSARINLSIRIMDKLVETFSPPKLCAKYTNYVTIAHVSKTSGNIFCHVNNNMSDLRYVEKTVKELVASDVSRFFAKVSPTRAAELIALKKNNLCLVYSHSDKHWYRATLLRITDRTDAEDDTELWDRTNAFCFLVDYGIVQIVSLNYVFALTGILSKYPYLAIQIRLDGVNVCDATIKRMKDLLKCGDIAMVDVIASDERMPVTMVKMTKWIISGDERHLCVVNDVI